VSLRPWSLAFNPRLRRLSTPKSDAFQLHPDIRSYGTTLSLLVLIWIFALVTGVFATKWVVEEGIFHKDADGSWDLNGDEFARHAKAFFEDVFSGFGAEINFGGDSSLSVREARRLLGVSAGATEEEITKAFRKMSIKWHPDKYKGDKDEAMEMQTKLNEARETLIGSRKGRAGGKERDVEAEVRAERAEERARRADEVRSIHWSPYGRVRVVNAIP